MRESLVLAGFADAVVTTSTTVAVAMAPLSILIRPAPPPPDAPVPSLPPSPSPAPVAPPMIPPLEPRYPPSQPTTQTATEDSGIIFSLGTSGMVLLCSALTLSVLLLALIAVLLVRRRTRMTGPTPPTKHTHPGGAQRADDAASQPRMPHRNALTSLAAEMNGSAAIMSASVQPGPLGPPTELASHKQPQLLAGRGSQHGESDASTARLQAHVRELAHDKLQARVMEALRLERDLEELLLVRQAMHQQHGVCVDSLVSLPDTDSEGGSSRYATRSSPIKLMDAVVAQHRAHLGRGTIRNSQESVGDDWRCDKCQQSKVARDAPPRYYEATLGADVGDRRRRAGERCSSYSRSRPARCPRSGGSRIGSIDSHLRTLASCPAQPPGQDEMSSQLSTIFAALAADKAADVALSPPRRPEALSLTLLDSPSRGRGLRQRGSPGNAFYDA